MAFVSGRSGNDALWVASADGSNARQVTHDARQSPGSPAWSPDGTVIAFDSAERAGFSSTHIWTVAAEGGAPRQLTTGQGDQAVPTGRATANGLLLGLSQGTHHIWRVRTSGHSAGTCGANRPALSHMRPTMASCPAENADSLLLMPHTPERPRRLMTASGDLLPGRPRDRLCAGASVPTRRFTRSRQRQTPCAGDARHFQGATH